MGIFQVNLRFLTILSFTKRTRCYAYIYSHLVTEWHSQKSLSHRLEPILSSPLCQLSFLSKEMLNVKSCFLFYGFLIIMGIRVHLDILMSLSSDTPCLSGVLGGGFCGVGVLISSENNVISFKKHRKPKLCLPIRRSPQNKLDENIFKANFFHQQEKNK